MTNDKCAEFRQLDLMFDDMVSDLIDAFIVECNYSVYMYIVYVRHVMHTNW